MSEYNINGKPTGYSIGVAERAGANYAEMLTAKQRELDEATALLERWCTPGEDEVLHDLTRAFLSSTTKQPAAPTTDECHPAYCKHPFPWPNADTTFDELLIAYESLRARPAAPEPSADKCRNCGGPPGTTELCVYCALESAESQLADARSLLGTGEHRLRGDGQQSANARAREGTAHPSPGAGGGK